MYTFFSFFCLLAHLAQARFRKSFAKFEDFVTEMGSNKEFYDLVMGVIAKLVEQCKEAGGALVSKIRFDYAKAEAEVRLSHESRLRFEVAQPDDIMIPIDEYEGDPASKGHRVMDIPGDGRYVLVPESRRKRFKRSNITDHIIREDMGIMLWLWAMMTSSCSKRQVSETLRWQRLRGQLWQT